MTRKRIPFNKSMRSDKRDERFAYWRQNALNTLTEGLYPSKDYIVKKYFDSSSYYYLEDVIETLNGYETLLFTSGSSGSSWYFWDYSNLGNLPGRIDARLCGAVAGGDGIYTVHNDLQGHSVVGKVTTMGGGSWNIISTFPTDEIILNTIGIWDTEASLYWWINSNGIWKQQINSAPVKVHNAIGGGVLGACIYQSYIALLVNKMGDKDFSVLFWDKANGDVDLFDEKVDILNATPFAIGNLSGKLTIVYAVGNTRNQKEFYGEMVIGQFDGYKFTTINTWYSNTYKPLKFQVGLCGTDYGVGSDVMIIPLTSTASKRTVLTRSTFIKVNSDGEVEVEKSFENPYDAYPSKARVLFSKNVLMYTAGANHCVADNLENFNDYKFNKYNDYTTTEYITNFLENPYDVKKLNAFSITFEKLFKNTAGYSGEEQVDIYYRTSDREDFTLLASITATDVVNYTNKEAEMTGTTPIPQQRYDISQMPDGSSLPSFSEIQFYFKLKNGMSLIDAFYEYENITHTTFN